MHPLFVGKIPLHNLEWMSVHLFDVQIYRLYNIHYIMKQCISKGQ